MHPTNEAKALHDPAIRLSPDGRLSKRGPTPAERLEISDDIPAPPRLSLVSTEGSRDRLLSRLPGIFARVLGPAPWRHTSRETLYNTPPLCAFERAWKAWHEAGPVHERPYAAAFSVRLIRRHVIMSFKSGGREGWRLLLQHTHTPFVSCNTTCLDVARALSPLWLDLHDYRARGSPRRRRRSSQALLPRPSASHRQRRRSRAKRWHGTETPGHNSKEDAWNTRAHRTARQRTRLRHLCSEFPAFPNGSSVTNLATPLKNKMPARVGGGGARRRQGGSWLVKKKKRNADG